MTVRILSKWWVKNSEFFDYQTPHPLYRDNYGYKGVRQLREVSDNLNFDIYCQVIGVSKVKFD